MLTAEREAERARRRELYERDIDAWTNEELAVELRRSYRSTTPPPCRICGGPLSLQAAGGGGPHVWACSGRNVRPSFQVMSSVDDHYNQSQWYDPLCGGDERVMELLRRYEHAVAGAG